MKKIFAPALILFALSFTGCDLISELVPDVDTDFTKTFQIQVLSNNGFSDVKSIDATESDEYNDFKDNIEGFELRKITYLIKNLNAPEDMYFSGDINCSNEEETESYTIGTMSRAKLSELEEAGLENEATPQSEHLDKVLSWLDSPGRFNVKAGYTLTGPDGTPYLIDGTNRGANFEVVVKFYLTVKTKV